MSFLEDVQSRFTRIMADGSPNTERAFRQRAWNEFHRVGLPSRKTETWKYSSLTSLTKATWSTPPKVEAVPDVVKVLVERWRDRFDVLVIINGELCLGDSSVSSELREMIRSVEFSPETSLQDGFHSLSIALSRPSFRLDIPAGVRVLRPVLLVRYQHGEGSWTSSYGEIHLGERSRLNVAEIFVSESRASVLRSEAMEAYLDAGACMKWLRVQSDDASAAHFSEVQTRLSESAELHLSQLNGGARWSRATLRSEIVGMNAEVNVSGLSFGKDHQQIDQRVVIQHRSAETRSSQLFKNVLKDQARGAVNGKIYIAKGAQKVLSSQLNHNLLLSPTAEADTKPELEIYADDVKANHGASVGRLDEEKLFYLISRGIPPEEARQMLAHAFVGDVLMKIQDQDLAALAEASVRAWLPEFATELKA